MSQSVLVWQGQRRKKSRGQLNGPEVRAARWARAGVKYWQWRLSRMNNPAGIGWLFPVLGLVLTGDGLVWVLSIPWGIIPGTPLGGAPRRFTDSPAGATATPPPGYADGAPADVPADSGLGRRPPRPHGVVANAEFWSHCGYCRRDLARRGGCSVARGPGLAPGRLFPGALVGATSRGAQPEGFAATQSGPDPALGEGPSSPHRAMAQLSVRLCPWRARRNLDRH